MNRNETLTIEGLPLHICLKEGSPDQIPLLLCNGIGMGLGVWGPLSEQLDRSTLAFDVPLARHDVGWPLSLKSMARLVVCMLDQLNISQVDVLGVSWGGTLAQELAYRYPDRVHHLVLVSTGCVPLPPLRTYWAFLKLLPSVMSALLPGSGSKRVYDIIAPMLYGGDIVREPHFLSWLDEHRSNSPLDYVYQSYALLGWTSLHWLHTLPHRTLVMGGDDDPLVSFVNSKLMVWCLPNATLHVEQNGGHLFLLTRTEESLKVIKEFLDA